MLIFGVPQNEEWMYAPTAMKMVDFVNRICSRYRFPMPEDSVWAQIIDSIDNMEEGLHD